MVKKIILAVFFSIFICVFIGFNYLLIQKETTDIGAREMETEMTAKSATISNQVDRINELERRTSDLIEQIATLREQGEINEESIASLDRAVVERDELLGKREDLINKLKQGLDVDMVGLQASEWIGFINNGDYEKSYARFNRGIDNVMSSMVLSEFRSYYEKQVGMIEVKSIDVMTRGIPEAIDNDLVIAVVVDLITPRSMELFAESLDKRRVVADALAEAEARAEAARLEAEAANELLEQMRAAAESGEGEEDGEGEGVGVGDGEGVGVGDGDGAGEDEGDAGGGGSSGSSGGDSGGESGAGGDAGDIDGSEGSDSGEGGEGGEGAENGGYGYAGDNGEAGEAGDNGETGDVGNNGDAGGNGADGDVDDEEGEEDDEEEEEEEDAPDPFDRYSYLTAGAVLEAMAEYEYIYTDDMDDSIFNTGENQLFFLMNYKKEANDWEIIKIVQKL